MRSFLVVGRAAAAAWLLAPLAARAQAAPFTLVHLTSIGCDTCDDTRRLSNISDVAVDSRGEVLVADRDAPMLRLFSREGKALGGFGRPGRGPGEYVFPWRVWFGRDRSIHVLDLNVRRITHLGADGAVKSQVPVTVFPGGASARGETGEVFVLSDDFRETLTLLRFAPDSATPTVLAKLERNPQTGGEVKIPGIAVSPDGELALVRDNAQYRIARRSPGGAWLADLVRDIPRPVRSAEEQAALESELNRVRGALVATEKAQSKSAPVLGPDRSDHSLKPHFPFSGLAYDAQGRLWILTSRGTATQTIFDLFGRDGTYLGALTLPQKVWTYSLGGAYLVTAGEHEDGTPVVDVWEVHAAR